MEKLTLCNSFLRIRVSFVQLLSESDSCKYVSAGRLMYITVCETEPKCVFGVISR